MSLHSRPILGFTSALLTVLLVSCGGGGSSSVTPPAPTPTPSNTAPTISNLVVSPQAVYVSATPATFSGQIDFADPDGNLASLMLTVTDSSGAALDAQTVPVSGAAGVTSGVIQGTVLASAATAGNYSLQVQATDAGGLQSNLLSGSIRIVDFPWKTKAPSTIAREYAAVAALGGRIYVLGGQRTDTGTVPGPATAAMQAYDPSTDSWSSAPPMPTARMGLVAAVVNGKLYAIGGSTDGYSTSAVGTVEEFDPLTQQWTSKAPMPTPRRFAAGGAAGGLIVIAGGEAADTSILGTVESYDPSSDSWTPRAPLATPRSGLSASGLNGSLYVVGGYAGTALQWVGNVDRFDPTTGLWTAQAQLGTARSYMALAALNGALFAAGGENVNRSLDLLEAFDATANAWSTKTASPTPFTRAAADVVNGKVYVLGNGLTLEYDPANEIR